MSQTEGDSTAEVLDAGTVPLSGNGLSSRPWSALWGANGSGLGRLYRATRIYIAFTLWFTLAWLLADFYYYHPGYKDIFRVEYPFALYLFFALNQILRPSRWRPLLAALPVVVLHLVHDVHYVIFGEIPHLVQVKELPEVFTVGGLGLRAAMLGLGLGLIWLLVRQVQYNRRSLWVSLPFWALVLTMAVAPARVMGLIESGVYEINPWLDLDNAVINGRLTTAIYNEAKRRVAVGSLSDYAQNADQRRYYDQVLSYLQHHAQRDRQVFILVLESFLDPRLLKPLKKHEEYLDAEFLRHYGQSLGFSVSPVFAGGTAQAEFEILCGVPAFSEFSQMEFNLFHGHPIPCLPRMLNELGYDTLVNYPYLPAFFNARRAYPGLGFSETYYAREHTDLPSYLHLKRVGEYLFDGDFFQQNREFLEQRPGNRPLLNYNLTMYGHMYYDVLQPIKWKVDHQAAFLENIVNISYYRSVVLDQYLQWVSKQYPKSLVIAISDHLPLVGDGPKTYKEMEYLGNKEDNSHFNRVLVIKDGKPTRLPDMNHFSVPYLVYDYLTDGGFCKQFDCPTRYPYDKERLRERYRYLMASAAIQAPSAESVAR